jgi:Tol biopolymer transport system component
LTVHLVTHGADRVIVSYPEELGHGGPNQGPVRSISFSADGRYLVLFNMFSRGTGQAAPFQIRGLAGELVYSLDTSALFPVWSGSGSRLFFRKGQCCGDQGDLMSWEPGTSVKTVVPNLAWYAPAQSPDGRWIAYTTAYGPSYLPHIGLFSPASGDAKRISEKPRSFPVFVSSKVLWFGEEAPVANGMSSSEPTGKFLAYNLDSGQESALSLRTGAVPTGFSLSITDVWPRPGP